MAQGYDNESDEVLVTLLKKGEEGAFAALYRRHYDRVRRPIARKMREFDPIKVDDVVQEAFLALYRKIDQFKSAQDDGVLRWLHTIARNKMLDAMKVEGTRRRHETFISETMWELPTRGEIDDELLAQERICALHAAIARLEPAQQECIKYRFLLELSVLQTAQRMGKSEGAVKVLQYRAVRRLQHLLQSTL